MCDEKAARVEGIPAELWKSGGDSTINALGSIIPLGWQCETLLQDFRIAKIVSIFMERANKIGCENYRGTSILSVAGKVLVR